MKVFAVAVVFLAVSSPWSPAFGKPAADKPATTGGPASPNPSDAPRALPPLRFNRTPLGNVVRVLSARFNATVSIAAHAKAPVSGDFSGLGLGAALAEAGRQAGLAAVPLGTKDADGFRLEIPKAGVLPAAATAQTAAASRRAELLHERKALLEQAAREDARAGQTARP